MSSIVDHLRHPFTFKVERNQQNNLKMLSREEKVTAVAAAILVGGISSLFVGTPVLLFAGIPAFFALTAYFKNRNIEQLNKQQPQNVKGILKRRTSESDLPKTDTIQPRQRSSSDSKVHFGPARERLFNKDVAPEQVRHQISYQECDLTADKGPQREDQCSKKSTSSNPNSSVSKNISSQDPYTPVRSYPPTGLTDTIRVNPQTGKMESVHSTDFFFDDRDILYVNKVYDEKVLDPQYPEVKALVLSDGKVVIQQQATRGCIRAAAAMLIHDLGGQVDVLSLKNANSENNIDGMLRAIQKAGFTPIETKYQSLEQLQRLVEEKGSAIVNIQNHFVVVDRIDSNRGVLLRDPYHGWRVVVKPEVFENRICKVESIIQAAKAKDDSKRAKEDFGPARVRPYEYSIASKAFEKRIRKEQTIFQTATAKDPKRAKVNFGPVRVRPFDHSDAPGTLKEGMNSLQGKDLRNVEGPQNEAAGKIQRRRITQTVINDVQKSIPGNSSEGQYPYTPTRRYPPISVVDTVIVKKGQVASEHGKATIFQNDEILYVRRVHEKKQLDPKFPNVSAEITRNGKAVIQQQATRGCTAAAAAMLIYDMDRTVDVNNLMGTNLGDNESMKRDIENAGLIPVERQFSSLEQLKKMLEQGGSAIVSVSDPEGGGHVVVVDEIHTNDAVTLRDPYHGWKIVVKREAFENRVSKGSSIIQVVEEE